MPPAGPAPVASDLSMTRLPVDTGKIRLDLSLFLSQADRLTGRFVYNRGVLDEARVLAMRDRFLRILAAVATPGESSKPSPANPLFFAGSAGFSAPSAEWNGLSSTTTMPFSMSTMPHATTTMPHAKLLMPLQK